MIKYPYSFVFYRELDICRWLLAQAYGKAHIIEGFTVSQINFLLIFFLLYASQVRGTASAHIMTVQAGEEVFSHKFGLDCSGLIFGNAHNIFYFEIAYIFYEDEGYKMGPKGFEPLIPALLSIAMLVIQQSCTCEGDVIYGY